MDSKPHETGDLFTSDDGFRQAQEQLRSYLRPQLKKGGFCPCCQQFAKIYPRLISEPMGYALVLIARHDRAYPGAWIDLEKHVKRLPGVPSTVRGGGDVSKLTYWDLIEKFSGKRPDGSRRVGLYRMTQRGRDFVSGQETIPKYAKVYNGEVIGFSEETIRIQDVFGKKFSYDKLMSDGNLIPSDAKNAIFDADLAEA